MDRGTRAWPGDKRLVREAHVSGAKTSAGVEERGGGFMRVVVGWVRRQRI